MNRKPHIRTTLLSALAGLILAAVSLASCDRPDTCEGSSTCINGYLIIISNCTCFCENEWHGERCDLCTLTDSDCPENGYANGEQCKCECDPGWCGPDCDIPVLDCENGGAWNDFDCACDCPPGWAGAVCDSII